MNTHQMATRVKKLLNREEDDDLFEFPGEYYEALSEAHRYYYRLIAQHAPDLLYTSTSLTSSDSGATYLLTDDHFGEIMLFEPPGPPTGRLLYPSNPEGFGDYWLEDRTIRMITPKNYSPLYVRWIPSTVADLDDSTNSSLPVYCDEMINNRAAYIMAQKPGFLGDPSAYRIASEEYWAGSKTDISDSGVLGIISRQSSNHGMIGIPDGDGRWWRFIR